MAEGAFSTILLTGAGLMTRSLLSLQSIRPGFQTENVLTWRISPSRTKNAQGPAVVGFYSEVLSRVRTIPGVDGASAITDIFLSITPNSASFTIEGHPSPPAEQQIEATIDSIAPNYFQTMQVPLRRGRFFDEHDSADAPGVVIVNETMAKRFWPGEDPIGKRFRFGGPRSKQPWLTVAGIAGDMRRQGMERGARCETFQPLAQRPARGMTMVVHTASDPGKLVGPVRDAFRATDNTAVMFERSTIAEQIGDSLSQRRFETLLLGLFSLLALTLATVGIYGVVFQSVSQRTNEIGIRVALGAQKGGLLGMIMQESLRLVLLGAVLGGLAALAISRAAGRRGRRDACPAVRIVETSSRDRDSAPVLAHLHDELRGRVGKDQVRHFYAVDLDGAGLDFARRIAHGFGEPNLGEHLVDADAGRDADAIGQRNRLEIGGHFLAAHHGVEDFGGAIGIGG